MEKKEFDRKAVRTLRQIFRFVRVDEKHAKSETLKVYMEMFFENCGGYVEHS